MFYLQGGEAVSHFHKQRLLSQIIYHIPQVTNFKAEYIYFVDASTQLTIQEKGVLSDLLQNTANFDTKPDANLIASKEKKINIKQKAKPGSIILVVPSFKSQSPWSCLVTEIVHYCHLEKIKRVERGICYCIEALEKVTWGDLQLIAGLLHDPITELVLYSYEAASELFKDRSPQAVNTFAVSQRGAHVLSEANQQLNLGLDLNELNYLATAFQELNHNPTDVELLIYANTNSEACRHKIFNAQWVIDGLFKPQSLLAMLKNTVQTNPRGILSAYEDHAAVIAGGIGHFFSADLKTKNYSKTNEPIHIVIKVENQNFITGISPAIGGALSVAGVIRDITSTGKGGTPKAVFMGLTVANLFIPGFIQPWEFDYGKPQNLATALDIALEAPLSVAQYANELGIPCISGYFRTFTTEVKNNLGKAIRGYSVPVMLAGGIGNIRASNSTKGKITPGMQLGLLGGPSIEIGYGNDVKSLSSIISWQISLDATKLQYENAEMERRCQEVINTCINLGGKNPIASIHDVGTGGLANSIPELLYEAHVGASFEVGKFPASMQRLSPLEIWGSESQEGYIVILEKENVELFQKIAKREACSFNIIGEITADPKLACHDNNTNTIPINLPLGLLFDKIQRERKEAYHLEKTLAGLEFSVGKKNTNTIKELGYRLLSLPCIADKSFIINILDRSAQGLVVRDQMVGPWQVPVADCAITARDFLGFEGEAMALGERPLIALINPAAAARMALGEALMNIVAANIAVLSDVRLALNSMLALAYEDEAVRLYETLQSLALELCPNLNLSITTGKDYSHMQSSWYEGRDEKKIFSPQTLVISAFAPVMDVRRSLTPELQKETEESSLIFIDLAAGQQRLGGSALAQALNQVGDTCPDLNEPSQIKGFFSAMQQLNLENKILAYHDRSDGGLFVTLCEMAFASHLGLELDISTLGTDAKAILFNEELGAVIQIRNHDLETVFNILTDNNLQHCHVIGSLAETDAITIKYDDDIIFSESRVLLQKAWSETSFHLQSLRDNPRTAKKQFEASLDIEDPGVNAELAFDIYEDITAPFILKGIRPKIAILREQGTNGQKEMAAAFESVGFDAIDVHMNDLANGEITLTEFKGLAFCAGFSFGDALGAGRAWAKRILYNDNLKDQFSQYFQQTDTFTMGVGNGAQVLSHLKSIIPGAELWPKFVQNHSEQFECRLVMVEIDESPSILFKGMQGSSLPVVVAHKEGYAEFETEEQQSKAIQKHLTPLRFVDTRGRKTNIYPANPNGSPLGITGLTTPDGRVTIMMIHPERCFRSIQYSWHPKGWGDEGPWLQVFRNARVWLQ